MRLLRAVDGGSRDCGSLSAADFERVGEYVMGRMAGSTSSHARMNTLMGSMMGKRGEEQMHALMGRRFTSCGGGRVPGSFGNMMGVMGMMGGAGNGSVGGTMMGGSATNDGDSNGWSAADVVIVVVIGTLLLLATGLLVRSSRAGGRRSPLEVLHDRYARGEIETEEYERRRAALGESS